MTATKTKPKNQREVILSALRKNYHEIVADKDAFPIGMLGVTINMHSLKNECHKNRNTKIDNNTKNFKPLFLEPIKDNTLPNIVLQHQFDPKSGNINFQSESGMFKLTFSNGAIMLFSQRSVGFGRSEIIESCAVATKETLNKYYVYLNKQAKINSRPKIGMYKIFTVNSPGGTPVLNYEELKKKDRKKNSSVFHQSKALVENDVKQFFDNIDLYTRYDLPGSRRLLLVGEPGGGKTSAANQLAAEYADRMCVVQATDLKSVMMHTFNVSKAKIPTIIILEDAESTLPWGNSGILNFLDGINQPKTEKGCYMILTTNFPKAIEPRILKRPGRIDKIIKFGVLDETNSILCSKYYFEGILFNSKKDKKQIIQEVLKQLYDEVLLDNNVSMTGAQIKNLSEATVAYAV
jgi:GTPase SAR1 family protein